MQILFVDDNPLMQQAIGRWLTSQGYSVFSASNGSEALHQVRRQRCDLFLIDLNLPDCDGSDLLGVLRGEPPYAQCPAIAMSGLGAEHEDRARQDGFDAYLPKPVDLDELLATVQSFDARRLARAIGA